jgi:L,D-transpeptidase catalytic domain/Putative peptidoglycan binding domain
MAITALVAVAVATTLPAGSTIAHVDVSGLSQADAKAKVQATLAPVYERPLTVRVGTTDEPVSTADLGYSVDYDGMVRSAFQLAAHHKAVHVRLTKSISSSKLTSAVDKLDKPFHKAPRDARVKLGITKIVRVHGRYGRGLDTYALRKALVAELRRPTPARIVAASLKRLSPKVTVKALARLYSTYISVDRNSFKLRLFKRLRLAKTYPIAVGMAGLATPPGLRHVLDKQVNPAWHVPNSSWAGSLAGQTIPPGPSDPLKARLLDLGDGIGIHGTAEDWSIGTRASHGCIRMHVSDVIDLYNRVPVGTPVLIR